MGLMVQTVNTENNSPSPVKRGVLPRPDYVGNWVRKYRKGTWCTDRSAYSRHCQPQFPLLHPPLSARLITTPSKLDLISLGVDSGRLGKTACFCDVCVLKMRHEKSLVFSNIYYLFTWLIPVLGGVCKVFSQGMQTLSCSMWGLVPQLGIEPRPPALGTQSLSHWTTGEVLEKSLIKED